MGGKGIAAIIAAALIAVLVATNPTSDDLRERVAAELRDALETEMGGNELSRGIGSLISAGITKDSVQLLLSVERHDFLVGSVFLVRPSGLVNLIASSVDEELASQGGLMICGVAGQFFPCEEKSRRILARLGSRPRTRSNPETSAGAAPATDAAPVQSADSPAATQRTWQCSDLAGNNPDPEWRTAFARDAGLWNAPNNEYYYHREHEEFVRRICTGDLDDAAGMVGRGVISKEDAQRLSTILSIDTAEALSAPRPAWESRYAEAMEKLGPGLCTACADNVAAHYAQTPDSQCGRLAQSAIDGDESALQQLQTFPEFCSRQHLETAE